mmetsp:Transcript_4720/g.17838  ORF Transcript_4720/g.17838 Transcript_4720/m.17838 type:complete len:962 (+) Transcript_4720:82-2967(+)
MGCNSSKAIAPKQVAPSSEDFSDGKVVPAADARAAPASSQLQAQGQSEPENEPSASASDPLMKDKLPTQRSALSNISVVSAGPESSTGSGGKNSTEWARSDKKLERVRRQKETISSNSPKPGPHSIPPTVVSPENKHFLKKVLQKHFLFEGLEDEEINMIIPYMRQNKVNTGDVIFTQGDTGDCCYIIQTGVFAVSIDDRQLKQLRPKHTFGELAMLYKVNRTATVSVSASGALWVMDGVGFRMAMEKLSSKHVQRAMDFFSHDQTFKTLAPEDQSTLARACSVQVFGRGEQILREGEVGDWMFIVIEGTVQTVDRFGNQAVKKPGTLLGSAGLMYGAKAQVAGAKAIDNVTCLALGKTALERLLGNVEDVLRRGAIKALLVDAKSTDLQFFKQLEEPQQNCLIDKFEQATFQPGEAIISKGAKAQLVIVSEGEIAVMSADSDEASRASPELARAAAREVLTGGMTFGGQTLVSGADVEDYLVTLSPCMIHRISVSMVTEALQAPLSEIIRLNEIKKVLGDIFLFKNLTNQQIDRTVRSLVLKTYEPGQSIVKQGDEANNFYLIQAGTIKVTKDGASLRSLGRWDYFGERALLLEENRSATCTADEACICLSLEKSVFRDIVGIFRQELEHRMNLQDLNITMADLRLKAVVGRGSFGVVKLCFHQNDVNRLYALKCVSKKQVVKQGQQKSIVVERDINAQCYHPCIMQFIKTFQDSKYVYFLTEFLGGGDLFYAIREIGNLTKTQAQFYGASITCALEYLHARSIMYRDLKPENVLLDFKGNAKLVDMGCCKKAARTNTLVGTPEYFAPETILGKGYSCAIDWWALGVMMHEFVVGPLPFGRDSEDQLELFREILEAALQFPSYVVDQPSIAIVTGLLERTPELRLGASVQGAKEIKEHPYFGDFDWDALAGRYMPAPWTPNQKKLQGHWEMAAAGEARVGEGDDVKNMKEEAGMAWAASF